jgi:hypothetical protein
MRLLLLLPILFACQTSNSVGLNRICRIKQDGVLVEKRYLDDKNRTTCIVTYDTKTKNALDSIFLNYSNQEILVDIKAYSFIEGKYELNEIPMTSDFYRRIYGNNDLCNVLLIVKHKLLIEDVLNNICNIQSSVLPNGKDVSSIAIITRNSDLTKIKFEALNARFNNLSEIHQSYFYNQIMESFSVQIKNGYLQQEEYIFTDGVFKRSFFYEAERLVKSVIDVKYKDGTIRSSKTTYVLD